jgi:hypothetical protein
MAKRLSRLQQMTRKCATCQGASPRATAESRGDRTRPAAGAARPGSPEGTKELEALCNRLDWLAEKEAVWRSDPIWVLLQQQQEAMKLVQGRTGSG